MVLFCEIVDQSSISSTNLIGSWDDWKIQRRTSERHCPLWYHREDKHGQQWQGVWWNWNPFHLTLTKPELRRTLMQFYAKMDTFSDFLSKIESPSSWSWYHSPFLQWKSHSSTRWIRHNQKIFQKTLTLPYPRIVHRQFPKP